MEERLFRGYDRRLNVATDEGISVDPTWGRDDLPMIEVKVYENPKRASAFLAPATARALAQELLRAADRLEAG